MSDSDTANRLDLLCEPIHCQHSNDSILHQMFEVALCLLPINVAISDISTADELIGIVVKSTGFSLVKKYAVFVLFTFTLH